MRLLIRPRFIGIARLAMGLALFAQLALAAGACLLPDRPVSSAPVVVFLAEQDQRLACSGAGCVAELADADICLAEVTQGDRVSVPLTITTTPGTAGLLFFVLAPRKAAAPIATPRPDLVAGSVGSHLSILYCSFQI